MLLTLRILSYRNQSVPGAASAQFSGQGGTLGRAPGNALVLDDPGKYISRVHARVQHRDGTYYLEDLGSNPSIVNDRPLGKGNEIVLAHGDRVVIGDYLLHAVVDATPALPPVVAAPANDPTLPLFEPPSPPATVPLPPLAAATAQSPRAADAPAPSFLDPLAGASILDVAPGQPAGGDPLGLNLFAPSPAAPTRAAESDHVSPELAALPPRTMAAPPGQHAPAAPAASPGGFAIPHDYDPLADFFPAAVPAAAVPAPASAPAPAPAPALASAPASAPVPSATPPAPALASIPASVSQAPPAPVPPVAEGTLRTGVDFTAMYRADPAPAAPPMPEPRMPATSAPPAAPVPTQSTQAPAPAAERAGADDVVLQALLRGLGLPDLPLQRPPVEVAETVGAMLRIATEGTIDVLMARALTKKESRIDMTMLSVRANNPLKFFPHADGALTQMLTGALSGYLAPREAMAGAFDDLRAHELAVIAGMRAALGAVLERFDPARIEARLAGPSMMDKVLSANRKAKLWDGLVELYGELAREADDELQRLYGEKFSEAYEAQVARLRAAKE